MSSILKLCAQVCYTSFRHKFISAFTYKISVFTSKIDAKTQSNYEIGRNVEFRICTFLDNLGWITTLSPGSRGPADITATKRELTLVAKNFDENDQNSEVKANHIHLKENIRVTKKEKILFRLKKIFFFTLFFIFAFIFIFFFINCSFLKNFFF